jgi:hypothetical protein
MAVNFFVKFSAPPQFIFEPQNVAYAGSVGLKYSVKGEEIVMTQRRGGSHKTESRIGCDIAHVGIAEPKRRRSSSRSVSDESEKIHESVTKDRVKRVRKNFRLIGDWYMTGWESSDENRVPSDNSTGNVRRSASHIYAAA